MNALALLPGARPAGVSYEPSTAPTYAAETLLSGELRAPEESVIGTLLEQRYRIVELIGSGGMSRVYRAEHVMLGRTVAIKMLLDNFRADEELLCRVLREARATAAIDSPHVVEILDVGRLPRGGLYLVLECLEGSDLGALVRGQADLGAAQSLAIAMQLCDAVSAAHRAGVIHRDIKPRNVFVTAGSPLRIKLLDFGICKVDEHLERCGEPRTLTGAMLGTPHYMAPEQIEGGREVGRHTDIYAIGATLCFMLTGHPPFQATSLPRLLLQICEAELELPELPAGLSRVLARALAKRPEQRFSSTAALRSELETCARQLRGRRRAAARA